MGCRNESGSSINTNFMYDNCRAYQPAPTASDRLKVLTIGATDCIRYINGTTPSTDAGRPCGLLADASGQRDTLWHNSSEAFLRAQTDGSLELYT
jgi:hypothetical protein